MSRVDARSHALLVAIVDDEALVRTSMCRLCRVLGFEVTDYASGPEFLAALESGTQPDCLLLDAHMPEMTGIEVLQLLLARAVRFPTIMFTADDAPEAQARYVAAGAAGCLQKPMGADELVSAIESAVSLRASLPRPQHAVRDQKILNHRRASTH